MAGDAALVEEGAVMNPAIEMPMLDEEEYLVEPEEWTEGAAEELANRLEIELGDDQWYVIRFIRTLPAPRPQPQRLTSCPCHRRCQPRP